MSKSVFYLTTQFRNMLIDGEHQPVYLLNNASFMRATEVKVANRWSEREPPKYVVMGAFDDGYEVFHWDDRQSCAAHSYIEGKQFVGYIDGRGNKMQLERWHCISYSVDWEDYYAGSVRERIIRMLVESGVVLRPYVRVRRIGSSSKAHSGRITRVTNITIDIHSPNENDLVMAKLVLAGEYLVNEATPA